MRRIFSAIAIASLLFMTSCVTDGGLGSIGTSISNTVGVIAQTRVKSKSAYIAINVFNASERTATNYLNLPLCTGAGNLCRVNGAAEAIDLPFHAGIQARNDLRAFMKANKGTLADAGLYNTLVSATTALNNVMAIYGIGK